MARVSLFDEDEEPQPRAAKKAAVDAEELLELLGDPRFRLLQRGAGRAWQAYSRSKHDVGGNAFAFGAGDDPVQAIKQSLGIKE